MSNKRLQVFVISNPKQKYRFFRFLAGFYRFFCFPIQSNMRLKASCCFTKIKFPNASQSSLDHSKLTLTKLLFFFWKLFEGLLCFPIHNKNRRIISFLASFYRLLRFPIQSKNRRICSFQAGFYRFLWFPIQSKNNIFFRFLAGVYMFLYLQIQSNMRLKASCCFSKIKCPNASKSFRL